jgi:hypothetical protein
MRTVRDVSRYDEQVFEEFGELPAQHVTYLIQFHDNREPGAGRGWLGYGGCTTKQNCRDTLAAHRAADRNHQYRAVEHKVTARVLDW